MMATAVSVSDPRVQAALRVDDEGRLLVAVKGGGGGGGSGGGSVDLSAYETRTQAEAKYARKADNDAPITMTSGASKPSDLPGNALVTKEYVQDVLLAGGPTPLNERAVADVIGSYGSGLIANGSAGLGSNFNFSGFDLVTSEAYSGFGAFKKSGASADVAVDLPVLVDLDAEYGFSFAIKAGDKPSRFYSYLLSLDIDGKPILPHNIGKFHFRLARPLSAGDNKVYIHADDYAATKEAAGRLTQTVNALLLDGQYVSNTGFVYPVGQYSQTLLSRNSLPSRWQFDDGEQSLTLPVTATGSLDAGKVVMVGQSGGTYTYWIPSATNALTTQEWVKHSGRFRLRDVARPFTAMVKVGWLLNRPQGSNNGTSTMISSVDFRAVERSDMVQSIRVPKIGSLPLELSIRGFSQHLQWSVRTTGAVPAQLTKVQITGTIPDRFLPAGKSLTIPVPGGCIYTRPNGTLWFRSTLDLESNEEYSTIMIPTSQQWRREALPGGWATL